MGSSEGNQVPTGKHEFVLGVPQFRASTYFGDLQVEVDEVWGGGPFSLFWLGHILHFGLLWFSGSPPLNC